MNFVPFLSPWPKPTPTPEDPQAIENLYNAIITNDDSAVKGLLRQGALMKKEHFLEATNCGSINILQIFLDNGWDINTPVDTHNPPALAYGTFSSFLKL
jgi:hypothetical protein